MNRETTSTIRQRLKRGLTLIEVLVVTVIIGLVAALAIPAYLSSVKTSRTNAANANAQIIANGIQSDFIHNGYNNYSSYAANALSVASIVADIGGSIPLNPCSGGSTAADWTITVSNGAGNNSKLTVSPTNASGSCGSVTTIQLGN